MNKEYIVNIVQDFEHCGECEHCKANETFNGTKYTFCQLLWAYKDGISRAITEVLDKL